LAPHVSAFLLGGMVWQWLCIGRGTHRAQCPVEPSCRLIRVAGVCGTCLLVWIMRIAGVISHRGPQAQAASKTLESTADADKRCWRAFQTACRVPRLPRRACLVGLRGVLFTWILAAAVVGVTNGLSGLIRVTAYHAGYCGLLIMAILAVSSRRSGRTASVVLVHNGQVGLLWATVTVLCLVCMMSSPAAGCSHLWIHAAALQAVHHLLSLRVYYDRLDRQRLRSRCARAEGCQFVMIAV